jgi:hypothetical protein
MRLTMNAPEEAGDSLVISYPRKDISDAALENLRLLVDKQGIAHQKGSRMSDALPIEVTMRWSRFPWFEGFPTQPEEISAYAFFHGQAHRHGENAEASHCKEKDTDNDKYAFRCFLLRLGFIGDEYKAARKILLRNLSGSGAFKSGNPKTQEYMVEKMNATPVFMTM